MTLLGVSTSYFVQHLVDWVLVRGEARCSTPWASAWSDRRPSGRCSGCSGSTCSRTSAARSTSRWSPATRGTSCGSRVPFFETRQVGEILSRVHDAAKVREAISGTTLTTVVDGTLVRRSCWGPLLVYDPRLALVATAFVPAAGAAVLAHHPAARRRSREAMEAAARFSAHLVEDVSGVETIKAFGAERPGPTRAEGRLVRRRAGAFLAAEASA